MGRSQGENSEEQLLPTAGFQRVAVVALGMEQGAEGGAGTAPIFVQELLSFTCPTQIPK